MIRLSLIIPVYNVEQYIARCLDSCLSQDIPAEEYEIIVVNDGSPDSSMAIVDNFCQKHKNIRIINRENGGLSAARNTGLEYAEGEYVWFIDSDDRISADCIRDLLNCAETNNLDVLCLGLNLEYKDGRIEKFPIKCDEIMHIYDGKDFIVKVGMPPAAWAAIYRRELLLRNGLKFYEGILHEDHEFTPRAYCLAGRIAYYDAQIYYYNQRDGGIMKSSNNLRRCSDLLTVADSLYAFTTEKLSKDSDTYRAMMQKVYFCITQSLTFYSKEAFPLSVYRDRPYFPMNPQYCSSRLRLKIMLANISLRLYILINLINRCLKK